MQWDNTATIGYNAGPDHHDNHDPSSSDIACANSETNNFTNVYYRLHEAEPLPIEPGIHMYNYPLISSCFIFQYFILHLS